MTEQEVIMSLDELTRVCGHFYTEPVCANSGYNCNHPDCEDGNEDNEGKHHGACFSFTCPVAVDLEDEDYAGFNGDGRMRVFDKALLSRLKHKKRLT